MNGNVVKLCTVVLENGVKCTPEFPHCIDETRCKRNARCFWRGFHQLDADKLRQKSKQKGLFA